MRYGLQNHLLRWDRGFAINMQKRFLILTLAFVMVFMFQIVLAGDITMTITDNVGVYVRGQTLSGNISITYSKYIPKTSNLSALIDGVPASMISLYNKLHDPDYYDFVEYHFGYNITAHGINDWTQYPERTFNYTVTVNGTCGGDYCDPVPGCSCPADCIPINPPDSYPCSWSISWDSEIPASVRGNEGCLLYTSPSPRD